MSSLWSTVDAEHNPVESSIIRLRERLNEDKIITPSELNVSVIIGQGTTSIMDR